MEISKTLINDIVNNMPDTKSPDYDEFFNDLWGMVFLYFQNIENELKSKKAKNNSIMGNMKPLYTEFALEIRQTLMQCLKSYKKEKGDFMPYFLKAWNNKYKIKLGEEYAKIYTGGMKIGKKIKKIKKDILQYQSQNNNIPNNVIKELANKYQTDEIEISAIINAVNSPIASTEESLSIDNDMSRGNIIADPKKLDSIFCSMDMFSNYLDVIQKLFAKKSEKVQEYLSYEITGQVMKKAFDFTSSSEIRFAKKCLEMIQDCNFFSEVTFQNYIESGKPYQLTEICQLTSKTNICKAVKSFWNEVNEKFNLCIN